MFVKGQSGNPGGRKPGNANAAKLRQHILDELPPIIEMLIAQAKEGDSSSAKLLIDRALPPLKAQTEPVAFPIASSDSLAAIGQGIIDSVSRAEISPDVGGQLLSALALQSKIVETDELIKRIEALENVKK